MKAGLYVVGENLSQDEATALLSPEFSHAVEILENEPVPEKLSEDADTPKSEFGYQYKKSRELDGAQAKIAESRTRK